MHRVQQQITLPNHSLILRILQRRSIRLYYPVHFINRAVQTTGRDEPRKFADLIRREERIGAWKVSNSPLKFEES